MASQWWGTRFAANREQRLHEHKKTAFKAT